jgi:hypothetical protein
LIPLVRITPVRRRLQFAVIVVTAVVRPASRSESLRCRFVTPYTPLPVHSIFIFTLVMADSGSAMKGAIIEDNPVSPTSSTLEPTIDRAAEKRLLRKLDLRILPVLWILYLVNFIDR